MKLFEDASLDDILDNHTYYRQSLAEESVLVFKHLNFPAIEHAMSLPENAPGRYPHLMLMWSFFCDYDFMDESKRPWFDYPVGVSVGQYHAFLEARSTPPKEYGIDEIVGNWHKDHYHYPDPTSVIAMSMHTFTCGPGIGDTVIVKLADAYDDCPESILDYLQGRSYIYTDVCGCNDPPLSAEHPALATHPVTGRTSLCYPGRDGGGNLACVPSDGSVDQWQEYEDWMWEYVNAPENQFRIEWEEGDFAIWDNRSCIHNYFGGWEAAERVFDRLCIGHEMPRCEA